MLLTPQLTSRLLFGLCTSLILWIGSMSTYIGYQWFQDWQFAHQPIKEKLILQKTDAHAQLIAAIPDMHLFGQAFSKGQVPTSNLQLHVTGIVKANEEESLLSKAYISIAGQPSKIYRIGDELAYGVKVYDITANMIILQNDGRLEKLPLPRESLEFKERSIEEVA